jgi:hypothetical protein
VIPLFPETPAGHSPAELTVIDDFPPIRIGPYFNDPTYKRLT